MVKSICILLIEDHSLVRAGLKLLLERMEGVEQVLDYSSIEAAIAAQASGRNYRRTNIDLVVLDLHLPGEDAIGRLPEIQANFKDAPTLILTADEDEKNLHLSQQAGAQGFLLKSSPPEEIFAAINSIISKETSFASTRSVRYPKEALTPRQIEVLKLICEGMANKTIADKLQLSENTVHVHVSAIFKVLKVSNRSGAIIYAIKNNLVRMPVNV